MHFIFQDSQMNRKLGLYEICFMFFQIPFFSVFIFYGLLFNGQIKFY